ncbi:MAG: 50S ribosomal protein L21 [Actinomycetota bacterium]|nr:50S ribosomal protein L21 [Actinomycetota bacterium]MDI6821968.1 50S ribosomal protein L21 [Actinomycetota bacterium]
MPYAIIESGGKQYKVRKGEEVLIEKIEGKPGDKVKFDKIIFLSHGDQKIHQKEVLSKVKVKGTIVEQLKGEKIIVFKYEPKKGYKRMRGHRQILTKVRIDDIKVPS